MTLDEALDAWAVHDPDDLSPDDGHQPKMWAVSHQDRGVVAYFSDEKDAHRFRLAEVNRALNG